jgi:nitroreductase
VPREDLKKIVQAGIQAPSGCNAQTTSFVIVDDPAIIAGIAGIMGRLTVRDARAIVVCVADRPELAHGTSFIVEDCAAAVENMLLTITALGYATVWIDGALRVEGKAQKIGELLGVPGGKEVRVILPIGEPREKWAQKEKQPFAERAWFNQHGKDR